MSEPTAPMQRPRRGLLIWALTATLAAVAFGNSTLILFMKLREAKAQAIVARPAPTASLTFTRPQRSAATFTQLQDSDVAGQYRFFQEGTNVGIITLQADHSMVNKDGETLPQYHWEVTPNGLVTMWQRGRIIFNTIVQPGVYVAYARDGSEYRRIEKVEQ
jgi:hypothetical protein